MSLERSLKEIGKALNRLSARGVIRGYALIGGLAVSTWGLPRGTKDIDLLVSLEAIKNLKAFQEALEKDGFSPKLYRGGPSDPVPFLLKVVHEGVPVDMLITTKKWEDEAVENSVGMDFHGVKIPVIPVEYLVVMKLKAGGPRDILDVEELLQIGDINPQLLEGLSKRLRVDKRLERIRRKRG